MKIGLDFDGVISDCGRLKSEGAKKLYGVSILPGDFKKEIVVGRGLLTASQYRELQRQIYENEEFASLIELVPESLKYSSKLILEGHELSVITSRYGSSCDIAESWMRKQGFTLPISSAGQGLTKANKCQGLDIYIDDDLDKLEALVDIVPNRFIFSWDYNKDIDVPLSVAKRVSSWEEFYNQVNLLRIK